MKPHILFPAIGFLGGAMLTAIALSSQPTTPPLATAAISEATQRNQQDEAAQQFALTLAAANAANEEVIAATRQADLATACAAAARVATGHEALTSLAPQLAPDKRKAVQPGLELLGQGATRMMASCSEIGL
jgi:hypothetical protein